MLFFKSASSLWSCRVYVLCCGSCYELNIPSGNLRLNLRHHPADYSLISLFIYYLLCKNIFRHQKWNQNHSRWRSTGRLCLWLTPLILATSASTYWNINGQKWRGSERSLKRIFSKRCLPLLIVCNIYSLKGSLSGSTPGTGGGKKKDVPAGMKEKLHRVLYHDCFYFIFKIKNTFENYLF